MTTVEVSNDPARPFVIHRKGDRSVVVQVTKDRVLVEVESASAHQRVICIHQLYTFFKTSAPEAICERDDVRFVAVREYAHAH